MGNQQLNYKMEHLPKTKGDWTLLRIVKNKLGKSKLRLQCKCGVQRTVDK